MSIYKYTEPVPEVADFYTNDTCIYLLYNLVLEKKPAVILELGVRGGYSTRALLIALKKTGGQLYSVDIENYPDTVDLVKRMGLDHIWTFIVEDDREFYKNFNETVDILFIDTSHKYEHTLFELEHYSKFVSEDGIILLHDTRTHSGVVEAIDEFIKTHPEWKFRELGSTHGMGCLERERDE